MTLYRAAFAALLVSLTAVVVSILAGSLDGLVVALVASGCFSYVTWAEGDAPRIVPTVTRVRLAWWRVYWRVYCRPCLRMGMESHVGDRSLLVALSGVSAHHRETHS